MPLYHGTFGFCRVPNPDGAENKNLRRQRKRKMLFATGAKKRNGCGRRHGHCQKKRRTGKWGCVFRHSPGERTGTDLPVRRDGKRRERGSNGPDCLQADRIIF